MTIEQLDAKIDALIAQLAKPRHMQYADRSVTYNSPEEIQKAIAALRAEKAILLNKASVSYGAFRR